MTENESNRNDEVLKVLTEKQLEAVQAGKLDEAQKYADMIQKRQHEQTEHEKSLSAWNDVCNKNENEQAKIKQADKQFKQQMAVTIGAAGLFGAMGIWAEKGCHLITVPMLKAFMKKLEDTALRSFRH